MERYILDNIRKDLRIWDDVDLVLSVHAKDMTGSYQRGCEHLGSKKAENFMNT